jgi:hypothetical protein
MISIYCAYEKEGIGRQHPRKSPTLGSTTQKKFRLRRATFHYSEFFANTHPFPKFLFL